MSVCGVCVCVSECLPMRVGCLLNLLHCPLSHFRNWTLKSSLPLLLARKPSVSRCSIALLFPPLILLYLLLVLRVGARCV